MSGLCLGNITKSQLHFDKNFLLLKDIKLSQKKEKPKYIPKTLTDLVKERTRELAISETWHRSVFDNATNEKYMLDKKQNIVNVNRKSM